MKENIHFKISWPVHENINLKEFGNKKQIQLTEKTKSSDAYLGEREKNSLYSFYTNLCEVLEELDIAYDIVYGERYKFMQGKRKSNEISLSYHSRKTKNNVNNNDWTVHTSGSAGYFTVDRMGYAGFSMFANDQNTWKKYLDHDLETSKTWTENFTNQILKSKESRNKQSGEFKLDEPYLFIAGQLSYDSVLKLTEIKQNKFYQSIADQAKSKNLKVVYKPHPAEKIRKSDAKAPDGAIVSHASIHSLISGSKAVAVINSGVGMEALVYKKPVYLCGTADYMHECKLLSNAEEVEKVDFQWKPNEENINRLLCYLHTKEYVDCYSKKSMRRKILQIVETL